MTCAALLAAVALVKADRGVRSPRYCGGSIFRKEARAGDAQPKLLERVDFGLKSLCASQKESLKDLHGQSGD